MSTRDVLVLGAGPAGAATAIRAARAGLSVTLVDRARFPRDKPCSEYMSPETVRHLGALGVLDDLDGAGGVAIAGTTVTGPRGSALTGLFARAGTPFRPTGLSLRRQVLDAALVDGARKAGVEVLEEHTVTDLLYERGAVAGAAARIGDGSVRLLHARLTVGADGLRSIVARRIGQRRHGFPARMAFVAHVAGVPELTDRAELHVTAEGYAGVNPVGGGVANIALVVPARSAAGARGDATAFALAALDRIPGVRGRVRRDQIVRPFLVTGPFAARSRRVITDGALLVGDAAEFFDPFTGEGICAALRGAELATETVVEALAAGDAPRVPHLAPYEARRRAEFLGKWVIERMIGWSMLAPRLFDRAVERIERRGLAHTLIGVTGDVIPPREVLNPRFLAGMVL
jgi:flavin-dependent dehydrogenase